MKFREYIEQSRQAVIKCAKRNKWVRYIVIGIIAVYLFFFHLLKGREKEWRQLAAGSVAVMLVITLTVHVQASVIEGNDSSPENTVVWNEESLSQSGSETADSSGGSGSTGETGSQEGTGTSQDTETSETAGSTDESNDTEESESTQVPESTDESSTESDSTDESVSGGDPGSSEVPGSTEESGSGSTQESGSSQEPEESGSMEEPGNPGEGSSEVGEGNGNTESSQESMTGETPESGEPGNAGVGPESSEAGSPGESTSPQEPGNEENGGTSQKPEDILPVQPVKSQVSLISRNGGNYLDGIFYAGKDAWYEIGVNSTGDVSDGNSRPADTLKYRLGGQEHSADVVAGKVKISIPMDIDSELVVYAQDGNGQYLEGLKEYVICEQESPAISQKVIQKEDKNYYLQINITEQGNIISGIKDYTWTVDNGNVKMNSSQPLIQYQEAAGVSLQTSIAMEILLTDFMEHTLQVTAQDNAGNLIEEEYVYQAGANDVISVVLPTSFHINMYPELEGAQGVIQSNDIIICNKSEFPVEVTVSKAEVNITPDRDGAAAKKCSLNLGLMESNKMEQSYSLPEGNSTNLLKFTLSRFVTGTNPQQLIREARSGSYIKQVESADYAALKLYGQMNNANWKDGDLSVKLIFDFKRTMNQPQG